MANREEYISVVNTLKATLPTITTQQRVVLLQQAVQQYGLSAEDAEEILKTSGLVVGESVNYFRVLGLSLDEIQDKSENDILSIIEETHQKCYGESLRAGGLPRPDGRTFPQDGTTNLNHTSIQLAIPENMMLIPEGEYRGRSIESSLGDSKFDTPDHTIHVDTFYIDKFPVTNAQFKEFTDANPLWRKTTRRNEWNKIKQKMSIFSRFHDGNYLNQRPHVVD